MSLWNLATSPKLETEGVWRDFPDDAGNEVRLLIARVGGSNNSFMKEFEKEIRPYRRKMKRKDTIDLDVQKEVLIRVMAKTVLLGWENVVDQTGKNVPYSVDMAIRLLTEVEEVFIFVNAEANELANYRVEEIEAEAKNSRKSSPTS